MCHKSWWTQNAMDYYRLWVTVKPKITHTLSGHQILWVITGYGLLQIISSMCHKSWWTQNAMGYYRLWVITVWVISGLTVSQYGLSQV